VISSAVQATIVAAVLLTVLHAGRRWSPAARESLVAIALAKFLVPGTMPGWGLFTAAAMLPPWPLASPAGGDPAVAERWELLLNAALVAHAAGVLLMAAGLGLGWWSTRRLLRRSEPVTGGPVHARALRVGEALGMRCIPRVWLGDPPDGPMAFGLFARHVVIPVPLASSEALEVVLAHEFAHHRRGDFWKLALHRAVVAWWWWHPLVWALERPLRAAMEDAADDLVLECGIACAAEYGEALVGCARLTVAPPDGLAFADLRHSLARRLERLAGPRQLPTWRTAAAAIAAALLLLPGIPASPGVTQSDDVRIVIRRIERPATTASTIVRTR
jgi:hypothetical protein